MDTIKISSLQQFGSTPYGQKDGIKKKVSAGVAISTLDSMDILRQRFKRKIYGSQRGVNVYLRNSYKTKKRLHCSNTTSPISPPQSQQTPCKEQQYTKIDEQWLKGLEGTLLQSNPRPFRIFRSFIHGMPAEYHALRKLSGS
ncbi:hypothetical protein CEXT_434131 [Caerostris extrusa]|uniref:Uncharacterized protein n=1 Tax=Caerostris extrusa TaxID=172846 RepID=A0AAV4YCX7_CAEEX|nr:hypothetical protein CEXT_434131 [Caerostris extrusa]